MEDQHNFEGARELHGTAAPLVGIGGMTKQGRRIEAGVLAAWTLIAAFVA